MLAQFLIDRIIKKRNEGLSGKISNKIFFQLRRIYLWFNSSILITYNLEGVNISLPLRHDLPIVRKYFLFYDSNIGRIPKYLNKKYSNFQAIDIGANVGDTAIIIKSQLDIPILCIEADDLYFKLLKKNTMGLNGLDYEQSFVGESGLDNFQFVSYKGSARLTQTTDSQKQIAFKSLTEITEKHSQFNKVKFIKIDTDGFDCKIIRSNTDYLKFNKPVIFFEYDPYFLNLMGDDGLSVFSSLKEIGYEKLLIYDNTGVFKILLNIHDVKALMELHQYYTGRKSEMYMDICVFHHDDNELADTIRESEVNFFMNLKNLNSKIS
jgi:FkbM family methyltransferase